LHGYFNSVDSAWDEHRLAEQFASSGMNALFVVPEAPSGRADDVFWKDLAELLRVVRQRASLKLPRGPVVVVGHSGAYRTLVFWLDEPRLRAIILLDGLYGYDAEFARWLSGSRRRAVLVAADTAERTEVFLRRFPKAARLGELPESLDELTPEQRMARILYLPTTRFDHMGLVTGGKVVPLVLGLAPLPRVQPVTTSR
ncbi:MAG: alpha/beta fold hydrolase, partial [Myxococcaceae bacterium]